MEVSDYELIQNCIEGDQNSFSELVTRYKRLVYSSVLHYIKDREEVNDISQEVFIKIYKSLGSYNPQYKFSTWIVRITTNLCLDILRKKKLQSVPMEEIENLARQNDNPEKKCIRAEDAAEIRKAISQLPEKYRTLIILYHDKGATYKEMSDVLDKPMSIIKNRLFRARSLLKENLMELQGSM